MNDLKTKIIGELEKSLIKVFDEAQLEPSPIIFENDDEIVRIHFSHITDDGHAIWNVIREFKHPMQIAYITLTI